MNENENEFYEAVLKKLDQLEKVQRLIFIRGFALGFFSATLG